MRVIKRSGNEVNFDVTKIVQAISNANESVEETKRLSDKQIMKISTKVVDLCSELGRPVYVEEIQDMVEIAIMEEKAYLVAKNYITYRFKHTILRTNSQTNKDLLNIEINPYASLINSMDNFSYGRFVSREVLKGIAIDVMFDSRIIDETNKGAFYINNIDKIALRMIDTEIVDMRNIELSKIDSFINALVSYMKTIDSFSDNQASKPYILIESLLDYLEPDNLEHNYNLLKYFFVDSCNKANFIFDYRNVKSSKKKYIKDFLTKVLKLKAELNFYLILIENENIDSFVSEELMKDVIVISEQLFDSLMGEEKKFLNKATVTINLLDAAMKSIDISSFKDNIRSTVLVIREALDTCEDRFTSSFASSNPNLFVNGGFSSLKPTDKVIKAFRNGNVHFAFCYAGLKEASIKLGVLPEEIVNALFEILKEIYKSKNKIIVINNADEYISSYLMKKSQLCFGITKGLTDHELLENVDVDIEANKNFLVIDNKNVRKF